MEGRQPPPKASHPFPDYPDMTKFWGTPYPKALLKTFGVVFAIWGTILGINFYLTRHQKGYFGQDITMTKEEALKLRKLREITSHLRWRYELPVDYNTEKAQMAGESSRMLFDDGIIFNPPREIVQTDFVYAVPEEEKE